MEAFSTPLPLGNAPYTEELWVYVEALPDHGGGYNGFLLSRGAEGPRQGVHVVLLNGHVGLTHWGLDTDTGIPVELRRWTHVATTWDGTTERLFVDGAPVWQQDVAGGLAVAESSVTLGRHDNHAGFYFAGRMDDVRIWSGARTPEQIMVHAFMEPSVMEPGLLAWWRFEEASGEVTLDSSPGANHATLGASASADPADPVRVPRN